MSSFLVKKKQQKTFQERISKKAVTTQNTIKTAIRTFERFCYENYEGRKPDEIFDELRTFKDHEQTDAVFNILQDWIDWNYDHNVLTSTLRMYFSSLKQFLHYNGFKLHPQDIKDNLEWKKTIKEELYALELTDIQKIFQYAYSKKISYYLALISTGARPSELLQVRKKEIDTTKKRWKIRIEAENVKTRAGRSVFLTKETMIHLESKLKELEDNDLVWGTNENPRHSVKNEEERFNNATKLAGFTERYKSNNFRKITLYSFRSYFFGLASNILREGYAHKVIGHGGYLPQYDRMNDEKKIDWFLKLEPELTVDQSRRQAQKIEVLEEKTKLYEAQKDEMARLRHRIEVLEKNS